MYARCMYIYTGRQIKRIIRERDCFCLRGARKFNSAKHSACAINKGKLSMSNVIEYEYVTGGPLKGGQPASKGGANAPPPFPPLKETLVGLHATQLTSLFSRLPLVSALRQAMSPCFRYNRPVNGQIDGMSVYVGVSFMACDL